jgi:HSP20 family protein
MFIVPVSRRAFPVSRGFDRLFDDAFDRFFTAPAAIANDAQPARRPALDVSENQRQYIVTLDVPGILREDIQVSIEGRRVSIVAEAKTGTTKTEAAKDEPATKGEATDAADGERVILRERAEASYARSFTLPAEIDQAESQARLENGVLTLTLTKRSANAARLTVN